MISLEGSRSQHLVRIDVLRGIAILSVFAFHIFGQAFWLDHPGFKNLFIDWAAAPVSWWLFSPLSFGWAGVALFFVISGYVIHRSYLLNANFTWLDFLKRRFWRIYPAYFLFLCIFAWMARVSPISKEFIYHALLLQNISDKTFVGTINGSFWSIAVECQLYAMYPVIIWVRNKHGMSSALGMTIIVSAVVAIYLFGVSALSSVMWFSPFFLWPTWVVGAAMAESHLEGKSYFSHRALWIGLMVALLIASAIFQPLHPFGFLFAAFGSAAAMDYYVLAEGGLSKSGLAISVVGIWSYSIYLIHQPLIGLTWRLLEPPHAWQFILYGLIVIPLVCLLGWLSQRFIEQGSMRIGKTLNKRRSKIARAY